jgi:hypothetical protein
MITETDIELLKDTFATKEELQKMKSDLLTKLDSILKEILAMREEMTIITHKVSPTEIELLH